MKYFNINKIFGGILKTGPVNYYSYRPASKLIKTSQHSSSMTILENNLENQQLSSKDRFTLENENQILGKKPGILASALVHEVRNPLTNINLAAEFIGSGALDEEQKRFVEVIIRGVDRIRNLLNDFLVSHKAGEIHSEICSLNELVDDLLVLNNDRLKLKDVFIIKNYSYTDWKIFVKRKEIMIAFTNIIINAIEAMPAGCGKLKIKTGSANNKSFIEIEDNGMGISEENLGKIFNPYYTNKPGGMGLGLTTTRNIILSNGGTVDVKSEPGSGTRFEISFDKIDQKKQQSSQLVQMNGESIGNSFPG